MNTTVIPQLPRPAVPDGEDLYGEIEALCQLIRLGQGRFTLALIEYDLLRARDEVISEIRGQFSDLNVIEAALSPPPSDAPLTYNVLDQLKNVVQAASPAKPPDVLIITGLEILLPPADGDNERQGDELRRAIQPLNLGRNILAEMFPCPVLLCLPKAAMEILLTSAPDIVSWKSGFFVFESNLEEVRMEVAREASINVNWLERWLLRWYKHEWLLSETKRLAAITADARLLPAYPRVIARLNNRIGWLAVALGNSILAQQSFAEMLRLARCENDAQLINAAEKALRKVEKLRSQKRSPLKHSALAQQGFRGAAPLSETDSLFGRETELQGLLRQLTLVGNRFVTLWGETGSGKTSLVVAGVVPELEKQGYLSVVVREWEHPASALCRAIERASGVSLPSSGSLTDWLQTAAREKKQTLFIICDQFEQFFTKHPQRHERESLLREIGACLKDFSLPCKFIFILREDYLGRIAELERYVGNALDKNKRFYLSLFDRTTAYRVLRQLSDRAKLDWPDVYLNEVIKDLTKDNQVRPIELQLVGAALASLRISDEQAYSRAGRAEGLLTDYLQVTVESASSNKTELQIIKRVLLALVEEPDKRLLLKAEDISSRSGVSVSEVGGALSKLVSLNLVRCYDQQEENKSEKHGSVSLYELMHDVLVDSVLKLTRDIQDKRRMAQRILTRAREDVRINPRYTISLIKLPLLLQYLPATLKADVKVDALLRRSVRIGILKWFISFPLLLIAALICIQNTFAYFNLERSPYLNEEVVIYRGLPSLSSLPFIGGDVLLDTGFNSREGTADAAGKGITIYWGWGYKRDKVLRDSRVFDNLSLAKQGMLLYQFGEKENGVQTLLTALDFPSSYEAYRNSNPVDAAFYLGDIARVNPKTASGLVEPLLKALNNKADYKESYSLNKISLGHAVALSLGKAIKADPALSNRVLDPLLLALKNGNSNVKSAAALALGEVVSADSKVANTTVLAPLLSSLRDGDADIRRSSAFALGRLATASPALAEQMVDPLLLVLKDRDDATNKDVFGETSVSFVAAFALGKVLHVAPELAPKIMMPLLSSLDDGSSKVRRAAAFALGELGNAVPELSEQMLNPLLKIVEDKNQVGNEDALISVGKLAKSNPKVAGYMLEPLLLRLKDSVFKSTLDDNYSTTFVLGEIVRTDPTLAEQLFPFLLEMAQHSLNTRVDHPSIVYLLVNVAISNHKLSKQALEQLRPFGNYSLVILNDEIFAQFWRLAISDISTKESVQAKLSSYADRSMSIYPDETMLSLIEGKPLASTIRTNIDFLAGPLVTAAEEEAKNGHDPVQFLFEHLEGKRSLIQTGNATTNAYYRQAVEKALVQWSVSKQPEAMATQTMLIRRLEALRDHDERLHLRIAAWDALVAMTDSSDE